MEQVHPKIINNYNSCQIINENDFSSMVGEAVNTNCTYTRLLVQKRCLNILLTCENLLNAFIGTFVSEQIFPENKT